jgi:metal-responsive CopG/Arc/MetJ family transcriptional regulator
MAAGSTIITFRMEADFLAEMDAAIAKRNATTRMEIFDRSNFIRVAIAEKLEKYQRSRKRKYPRDTVIEL